MPAVAWPNICSPMYGLVFVLSQQLNSCRLQKKHSPHAIGNGTTTRSPTLTLLWSTSGPTSSTTPIGSWPSTSPGFMKDRKSTRLNSSHANISYAVFFFNDTATTEIYTLSLHDALPILVFVLSQQLNSCRLQKKHSPHAIGNGTTTRSPTLTLLWSTSGPTSSTTPIGSWPSTSPGFM